MPGKQLLMLVFRAFDRLFFRQEPKDASERRSFGDYRSSEYPTESEPN